MDFRNEREAALMALVLLYNSAWLSLARPVLRQTPSSGLQGWSSSPASLAALVCVLLP